MGWLVKGLNSRVQSLAFRAASVFTRLELMRRGGLEFGSLCGSGFGI